MAQDPSQRWDRQVGSSADAEVFFGIFAHRRPIQQATEHFSVQTALQMNALVIGST